MECYAAKIRLHRSIIRENLQVIYSRLEKREAKAKLCNRSAEERSTNCSPGTDRFSIITSLAKKFCTLPPKVLSFVRTLLFTVCKIQTERRQWYHGLWKSIFWPLFSSVLIIISFLTSLLLVTFPTVPASTQVLLATTFEKHDSAIQLQLFEKDGLQIICAIHEIWSIIPPCKCHEGLRNRDIIEIVVINFPNLFTASHRRSHQLCLEGKNDKAPASVWPAT